MSPLRVTGLALGLTALAAAGCGGSSSQRVASEPAASAKPAGPTVTAGPTTIRVTGRRRQRMDGWGASVVSGISSDPIASPGRLSRARLRRLDHLIFRKAGVNLVRVFGPGTGDQRGNVRPPRLEDRRFQFMRRVRRYGVRFMLTGGDAPGKIKRGAGLAEGAEDDYARYLASVLRFAEKRLKVPFSYAAVGNESSHFRSLLQMPPQQAAQVYERLAAEIRKARLDTRLVTGDDIGWGATLRYAQAALGTPGVRRAASVIASHSYSGSAEDRRAVAALARANGLRVWQTEFGTGCEECPDDRTMESAIVWSAKIFEDLTQANASAWFAFRSVADSTHGPTDALVVRQFGNPKRPYYATKRFYVFRQYSSAGPPGSRRLETNVSGAAPPVVAFRRPRAISVVVTNSASRRLTVDLDLGRRRGVLSARRTSPAEDFRSLRRRRYSRQPLRLSIPGQSVTTYVLR